jgi:hypothetical protein
MSTYYIRRVTLSTWIRMGLGWTPTAATPETD